MAYLQRLRETFWLIPGVMCLLGVVMAQSLVALDRALADGFLAGTGAFIYQVGAAGSRDLLGAIAGSMLAVASTTFSITIAVLALTSSSYGPRLVRNFMADRGNQLVLGTYVATYLYALLVLRSIRTLDGGSAAPFVPHLAVNFAVFLAVLSIAVLVWFIHHISDSIQVWTLADRVHAELRKVVDDLYPEQIGREPEQRPVPEELVQAAVSGPVTLLVRSDRPGYVLRVEHEQLMRCAVEADVVVQLRARPGSFVVEGGELARVRGGLTAGRRGAVERAVRRCLPLSTSRGPAQDVEFAVQQLVEMAVRALSPGTNDPYTAVNALDELSDGLAALARRRTPSPARLDEEGSLRVLAPGVDLAHLVEMMVDAVRVYACDHPDVVIRALRVLARVGTESDAAGRDHVRRQIDLVVDTYVRTDPHPHDLARIQHEATRSRLETVGDVVA
jgi:uncharacterized membrane protein